MDPGEGSAETLRSYGYRGKIDIMPNGSDVYMPAIERPRLSADADRELGTKPGENVFLFVGQMVLEKNIKMLVEAMDHLAVPTRKGDCFLSATAMHGVRWNNSSARTSFKNRCGF